jgi:hypothetical protein
VETSQIHGQSIVNEDPQIVVSIEVELFVSLVRESQARRERESEVSPCSSKIVLASKTPSIDGEKLIGSSSGGISRDILIKQRIASRCVRHDQIHRKRDVKIGVVSIPIGKHRFIVNFISDFAKVWNSISRVQIIIDDASLAAASPSFKIISTNP